MVFSREHNFQDKIVKRILNPDEVLETTEEQGAKSRNDVSTPVDYDVLETERK